jgi:hypothetical protein
VKLAPILALIVLAASLGFLGYALGWTLIMTNLK